MRNGIYIYGVIATSSMQDFGAIGIGNKPTKVWTIGCKDVAAVVSASPLVVYNSLAQEKTVKDLVIHQFVIEKVMEQFTIIPLKFGTMVKTEEEAITFLEKGYPLLSSELGKMEGNIELDVVATWELPKVLRTVVRDSHLIQNKQKEIALKDTASVEDKVALGQLVEQALQARKADNYELMLQTLKERATDVCLHDLANDEMIFNAAFLLKKKDEESFTELVHALDQKLEDTVKFRVIGPLPLYSFSTILFESIDPHSVEEAKKTFGLHGELTDKTIRDTYRQLARQCHPDKKSAKDTMDFSLLHAAYKTLMNFVENGLMQIEVYQWKKDFQ
ncbi:MAG TPA: GvpL/GvpF family gas vesicle protein [Ktedonobacteraceae bacterium]|nr:GvpL/GvpF family gas vesicle protein [Ktedonobacteraceae bacterium]